MAFSVEDHFIIETEKKLGAKFPPDYVSKMMIENGGAVCRPPDEWMLYPVFDSSDKKRLKRTCNDVVRETQNAHEWPGFPDDAVAIGSNGGGDKLVLLRAKYATEMLAEEVYWWDHETSELNMVASRFGDLVKG